MACVGLSKMRERVDLNSNGMSIESPGKIFKGDRWSSRYIVCKKPSDLRAPIFMVFKSATARNNNQFKASFALQNYVGIESGFELKKQSNTLAILTKEEIIILAFALAESLIIWESWLKNTCGQSQCFFVQLQKAPRDSPAMSLLMKEVRLHLHDSRFAMITGRPQKMLEYVNIDDTVVLSSSEREFSFATRDRRSKDDYYTVSSMRLPVFYRMLEKARYANGLHTYLSAHEGDWIPDIGSYGEERNGLRSRTLENLNGLYNIMNSSTRISNLDKGKSKSGFHVGHVCLDRPAHTSQSQKTLIRTCSGSNYYNTSVFVGPRLETSHSVGNTNYINISPNPNFAATTAPSSSRHSSFRSRMFSQNDQKAGSSNYCNVPNHNGPSTSDRNYQNQVSSRCLSLPDYVNVDCSGNGIQPATSTPHYDNTKTSHHTLYSNLPISPHPTPIIKRSSDRKPRRRSDNSVGAIFPDSPRPSRSSKQRSMVDFTASGKVQQPEDRYENWRKAKRFISAFKPKSESKRNIVKSNSTSALTFAAQPSTRQFHSSDSSNLTCDLDDGPPSLNIAVNEPMVFCFNNKGELKPPEGLIKLREELPFSTARSGVSAILAKRLHTTVRGSFSKYDGERATHHYTPSTPANENDPPPDIPCHVIRVDALDGIVHAVKSGQERLKQSDRRASTVSFKNNVILLPKRVPRQKDETRSGTALMHHLTVRNSASYSESTRSSTDSLSSDARSRISIKKRSSSPPRTEAPTLTVREPSQNTLIMAQNSSIDSLNSEQTTRSVSPRTRLPNRKVATSSSNSGHSEEGRRTPTLDYCQLITPVHPSSSSSVASRLEYVVIDPISTKAAREASFISHQTSLDRQRSQSSYLQEGPRRRSQGQSSVSDSVSLGQPTRQGFFRKYKKMRRNKKESAASTGHLNL